MIPNRTVRNSTAVAVLAACILGCGGEKAAPTPVPEKRAPAAKTAPVEGKAPAEPPAPALDPSFRGERDAYKKATKTYTVRLETTKGEIIIDVYRDLAPHAADRFRKLVEAGFYNGSPFHDVREGYAAKTGISPNPRINRIWERKPLLPDPVIQRNATATVSFITSDTVKRSTEIQINIRDNGVLDGRGMAPFGRVRDMKTPDRLTYEYDGPNRPDRRRIFAGGAAFLREEYPNLDYVLRADILKAD